MDQESNQYKQATQLPPLNSNINAIPDGLSPNGYTDISNVGPTGPNIQAGKLFDDTSKYDEGISYADATGPLGIQKHRHEEQGGMAQLGSALNQAIVGEIAGGTLEGIGYLLDIPQYADLIKGTEKEFGNWLSDIGSNIKEWTQDTTPIYTDPFKEGEFAPQDWSWWMSNLPSVASTLSLMIPSGAVVKGMSAGARALNLGSKLTNEAKWLGKGITQSVVSDRKSVV